MKKKLVTAALTLALVGTICVGLVACGNNQDPFYNKTYTLTGTCTIDWDKKDWTDSYMGESKDVSLRQIFTRHWDEIDWNKTKEQNSRGNLNYTLPPHGTLQEFLDSFNDFQQNAFKDEAGLKFSFSGKDDLKLTLTLTEAMKTNGALSGYPTEITMPFADSEAKFEAIKPHENLYHVGLYREGYEGYGVYKKDDTHFMIVFVDVNPWRRGFNCGIVTYVVKDNGDGGTFPESTIVLSENYTIFGVYASQEKVEGQGDMIKQIEYRFDFEDTKNK